jgi:hypothetical protein
MWGLACGGPVYRGAQGAPASSAMFSLLACSAQGQASASVRASCGVAAIPRAGQRVGCPVHHRQPGDGLARRPPVSPHPAHQTPAAGAGYRVGDRSERPIGVIIREPVRLMGTLSEWTKPGGSPNAKPLGSVKASAALMRRTQSAVDAAAELMKFSTSPELTPKRRMAYSNLCASPHRIRHIDLRDPGRGDGAAPPAAKLARLGTRPLPPPPVWDRRSSSIDSVSTEVVVVSPHMEGGLLPRRASPGGGAAEEDDKKFSPVNHPAAVRAPPPPYRP